MATRHWHHDVFFGLHYDLHASASDTELGARLTHEHLKSELGQQIAGGGPSRPATNYDYIVV